VRGDLTAILWKDKRNVNLLTDKQHPPVKGNFHDEHGSCLRPTTIQDYKRHMGYVDRFYLIMNMYFVNRHTWKWTEKLFFHLMDL
jgi:hypothetical protein